MRVYEYGRSMLEMMGVLTVIAMISVGGMVGYSKMMSQYRINKAIEQIEAMATQISAAGIEANSYAGLTTEKAFKLGLIPSGIARKKSSDDYEFINPFGGNVEINPADNNLKYTITYTELPDDACMVLATHSWSGVATGKKGQKRASSLRSITVSNGNTPLVNGKTTYYDSISSAQITFSNAVNYCSGNNNSISFEYF